VLNLPKSWKIHPLTSIITKIELKIFFSCLHATLLWHFTVKLQIIIQLMVRPSGGHSNHLKADGSALSSYILSACADPSAFKWFEWPPDGPTINWIIIWSFTVKCQGTFACRQEKNIFYTIFVNIKVWVWIFQDFYTQNMFYSFHPIFTINYCSPIL